MRRTVDFMNELDVAQIAFAPAMAPTGAPSVDLHRGHPEYFIPTTRLRRDALEGDGECGAACS